RLSPPGPSRRARGRTPGPPPIPYDAGRIRDASGGSPGGARTPPCRRARTSRREGGHRLRGGGRLPAGRRPSRGRAAPGRRGAISSRPGGRGPGDGHGSRRSSPDGEAGRRGTGRTLGHRLSGPARVAEPRRGRPVPISFRRLVLVTRIAISREGPDRTGSIA